MSASISWEPSAGTQVSSSATDQTIANGEVVGQTLQVDVQTTASGTELPSYNCTSTFAFTDQANPLYTYALNNVSWTCASAPVVFFCTYSYMILPISSSSSSSPSSLVIG